MNVEARVQEIEQCMGDFRRWAHSILGDEYEDISIDLTKGLVNYQEQIEESFEQAALTMYILSVSVLPRMANLKSMKQGQIWRCMLGMCGRKVMKESQP